MKNVIVQFFIFQLIVATHGQTISEYNNRVEKYFSSSEFYEALVYADSVISVTPSCAVCYSTKASAYDNLGNAEKTLEALDSGISINDSTILEGLLLRRAEQYTNIGKFENAFNDYQTVFKEINPRNYSALGHIAILEIYHLNRPKSGLRNIKKAYRLSPADPMIVINYTNQLLIENKSDSAREALLGVIDVAEEYPKIYYQLGRAYRGLKNKSLAIAQFEKSFEYGDDKLKYNSLIDLCELKFDMKTIYDEYRSKDNSKDFILVLDSVIERDSSCFFCYFLQEEAYRLLQQYDNAWSVLERCKNFKNEYLQEQVLYKKVILLSAQEKYADAHKLLTNIIEKNSKNYLALSLMGQMECFEFGKMNQGATKIYQAYKFQKYDLRIVFNYANYLLRTKKYSTCIEVLLNHLNVAKEYPFINFYLGECNMQLKNFKSALLYFEKVLASENDTMIKEAKYLIDGLKSLPELKNNLK